MLRKSIQIAAMTAMASASLMASTYSMAAGDPVAGSTKVAACAACHGAEGKSVIGIYPNLAGQWAPYLESSMKAYKNGERKGGMAEIMVPQSMGLSDQDIADIAAFYSSK